MGTAALCRTGHEDASGGLWDRGIGRCLPCRPLHVTLRWGRSQNVVAGPAASTEEENLLEVQLLGRHPRPK